MYPAIHTYKNYNKMQLIKCKSLVPDLNSMRMLQLQDIFPSGGSILKLLSLWLQRDAIKMSVRGIHQTKTQLQHVSI